MSSAAPPEPPPEAPKGEKSERYLTLVEHLQELRFRLIVSSGAVVVGLIISAIFTEDLIQYLKEPAERRSEDFELIYTEPTGAFVPFFQVALLGGVILAMPVIVYQVLGFVSPGLKPGEKRWLYGTVAGATLFFLAGVAFAYYVALPPGLDFLLNFTETAKPQIRLGSYIDFVTRLLFFTGVSFETPLVIMFLARIKVVNAKQLIHWWRAAVVGAFVIAAIVTPSVDPVTCTIVALPIVGLYVLGIGLAMIVQPRSRD